MLVRHEGHFVTAFDDIFQIFFWRLIMNRVKTLIDKFLQDESGASAVEYGLLVALVVAVVAVGVTKLGDTTNTAMTEACKQVNKGTAC